jgi:hypothetical protein
MENTAPAEVTDPASAAATATPAETQATPTATGDPFDDVLAQQEAELARMQAANQPETEAVPAAITTEPEPQAGETTPPADPKSDRILPNRVSTAQFSDTEQQAIALGKALKDAGETVPSLKERIEIVYARQQTLAPVATPAPEPEPPRGDALTELDEKLNAAMDRRKELAKSLGTEELEEAKDEIEQLRQQKATVESQQAKAAAEKQDAFATERSISIKAAKGQFPSSTDPKSELAQAIAARIESIAKDPARNVLLSDPKAPEVIAAEAAMQLAKLRAADNGTSVAKELAALMESDAPAQAAATATQPTPQVRKPTTAGGAASIPPATPPAPKALSLAEAANMSLADLEKLSPTPGNSGYVLRR